MNRRLPLLASVALASLVAVGLPASDARAQDATPTPAPTSVVVPDLAFILDAARGGMAEVALGSLAQQRAESQEVKSFAQQMVQDHGQANQELMQIASQNQIELPGEGTDPGAQMIGAALSHHSGQEFDLQYIAQQVGAHEATLALFQFAAEHAVDPEVKSFAGKHAPTIEQHLQHARELVQSMMPQSASTAD